MDSPEKGFGFVEDYGLKYVREMAFPRKTGTPGEPKAAQTIVRTLKEWGYDVKEENFYIFPHLELWLKSIFLFFLIVLFAAWLTFGKIPFLAFLFSSVFLFGVVKGDRLLLRLGRWVVSEDLRRGMPSKNILAHFPERERRRSLYLVAHYDSKSQSFSVALRTAFLLLGGASGAIFSLWIWIHLIRKWIGGEGVSLPPVIQGCFFLSVFLNLLLLFSRMGNGSAGALDNASGIGVLLETARKWASEERKGVSLHFIFTGAEEMGLLGSQMFLRSHGEQMIQDGVFLINLDSIGQKGKMRIYTYGTAGRSWSTEVVKIARKKGIPLRRFPLLKGIWMDHLPFSHLGIPAVSLSSIAREGWHIHTFRDNFNLVQKEGLEEMKELLQGVIESFEVRDLNNHSTLS